MKRCFIAFFIGCIFLTGCKTNPVSAVLLGRDLWLYQVHDAPGELKKIVFGGSHDLNKKKIKEYTMQQIAKLTQQKGKLYFSLYPSIDDALFDTYTTKLSLGTGTKLYRGYVYVMFWSEDRSGAFTANSFSSFQ